MRKYKLVIVLACVVALAFGSVIAFNRIRGDGEETRPLPNPTIKGKRVVERIALAKPKAAYNFKLTDMNNKPFSLEDYRGKFVLVGFIYTNCPDVCGILTQHYRQIQRKFADIINKDLALVFITTDPERDTPERLAAYTEGFQGEWNFLTGSAEQLQKVWDEYHVFVKDGPAAGIVYHTYMVALIDRQGMIRFRYIGLVDPEEIIMEDIKYLIEGER